MNERYCIDLNDAAIHDGRSLFALLQEKLPRDPQAAGRFMESERTLACRAGLDRTVVHKVYERLTSGGVLTAPAPGGRLRRIAGSWTKNPRLTIAVVLPVSYSEYIGVPDARQRRQTFLNGIVDRTSELGDSVCFLQLPQPGASRTKLEQHFDELLRGVSGVIHLGTRGLENDLPLQLLFEQTALPQVCLAGRLRHGRAGCVSFSPEQGLRAAAGCFLEHGHRDVALVFSLPTVRNDLFDYELSSLEEAARIFRAAGMNCRTKHQYVISPVGDFPAHCRAMARRFLDEADHPHAIWCRNDLLALSLQKAFAEQSVRMPEDLSIIGMDDLFEAQYGTPPLTTLRLPFYDCGRESVDMIRRMCAGKSPETAKFPPLVVERGSVGFRSHAYDF